MNWQSSARTNGRILARGKCLCAVRSNTYYTQCRRRLKVPVARCRYRQSWNDPYGIRRASVQSAIPQRLRSVSKPSNESATEKRNVRPVDLVLSTELLSTMSAAVDAVPRQAMLSSADVRAHGNVKESYSHKYMGADLKVTEQRNRLLLRRHVENKVDPRMEKIRIVRKSLPMNQYRHEILKIVNDNPFSIIIGATGSGKSTQVPQIILEDAIERGEGSAVNIICTQPRRIAVTAIANRVAAERNEILCDSVGYFMRFENEIVKASGSIQYCTIGSLLRILHQNPEYLDGLSHIVLDEVHERSVEVDMAMVALKTLLEKRTHAGLHAPRVVIMSATLDEKLFSNYFARIDAKGTKIACPILTVPGRTFPVTKFYLDSVLSQIKRSFTSNQLSPLINNRVCGQYVRQEQRFTAEISDKSAEPASESRENLDSSEDPQVPIILVTSTIAHIVKSSKSTGAILTFLPGWKEIQSAKLDLEAGVLGVDFSDTSKFKVYPIHSQHLDAQTDLFNPEEGVTKIILATNIAETSITIPEVEYVVDCGKHREELYNQEGGTFELNTTWISKSSSDQRAGRAGRVQSGKYFALFSEKRYHALGKATPRILRADLQSICLQAKALSPEIPIQEFISGAIEPPHASRLDKAIESLRDIDAITADEQITPLGILLASLPLHPYVGRMIVLGIVFRCLDPMLILCASTSAQNLFVRPHGFEREANAAHRSFDNGYNSDPVRFVTAFCKARDHRARSWSEYETFMKASYMSMKSFVVIQKVMEQIRYILEREGLVPRHTGLSSSDLNENSGNFALIRALSIAAHRGNIACRESSLHFQTRTGDRALMMRSSANGPNKALSAMEGGLEVPATAIVSYGEMGRSDEGIYILRNTTLISPVAAALFASEVEIDSKGSDLIVNKWLRLEVQDGQGLPPKEDISTIILSFREAWDQILFSAVARYSNRRYAIGYVQQQAFVNALVAIVSRDFGDEDVRRVVAGIEHEKKMAVRREQESQARAAREEIESGQVDRLMDHLKQAYKTRKAPERSEPLA